MEALDLGGLQFLKVIRTQIAVGLVFAQHMVQDDQDAMRDRDYRLLLAPPAGNAMKLGR